MTSALLNLNKYGKINITKEDRKTVMKIGAECLNDEIIPESNKQVGLPIVW
jgi:hypothetical protein